MSLLFDQNLSRRLPALLTAEFPGSQQVILAGLDGADDESVWDFAATHGLAIMSKDSDFCDMSRAKGPPPKVIWLRIGNGPTSSVIACLRSHAAVIVSFLADPSTAILELR